MPAWPFEVTFEVSPPGSGPRRPPRVSTSPLSATSPACHDRPGGASHRVRWSYVG